MKDGKSFVMGLLTGIVSVAIGFGIISGALALGTGFRNTPQEQPIPTVTTSLGIEQKLNAINNLLTRNYINDFVDDTPARLEKFYSELVASLGDPYTVYMSKDEYKDFLEDTEGTYSGIGVVVEVDKQSNKIRVVSPFEGSPGANAGILPGDYIISVNDYEVTGEMLAETVKMMKGESGSTVKVGIMRPGSGEKLEFPIVRNTINIPTVTHKMLENDIGYLRITQFDAVTFNQFMSAYEDLRSKNMKSMILDLRNNPGGRLDIVAKITDALVPKGTITYTEDKNGRKEYIYSDSRCVEVPLVVLVNQGSASASEVLSGAVQDMGVGLLVGEQTFGKGIVQKIYELDDLSAVKITVSKYYTPNGVCIQDIGLKPDHLVPMSDELSIKIASLTLEEDLQLKKAVDIVTGLMKK